MWKVVTSSYLNSPLKLFCYLSILTNNNLLLKIYCKNIVKILWQYFSIMIFFYFFILFFFLSFHFHPFTFHFFFSFFFFLLFSSTQVSNPPSFIFFFTSRTFQQHICYTSEKRERERGPLVRCPIAGGDRGRRKDKVVGDRRSPCGTTMSAAPSPLVLLPTTRLGQLGVLFLFFFFFFSYFLVLIQLYFKNWMLFCVLCLDYVRNGVDRLVLFFFFFLFLFSYLLVLIQLYFKNQILFCVLCLDSMRNRENEGKKKSRGERKN